MATTSVPLSVPLDRERLDRTWVRLIFGTILLVAFLVAIIATLLVHAGAGTVDVTPVLLVLPLGAAYVVLGFAMSWRRLRRVALPLLLSPDGLTMSSPFGEVVAPWSGVVSVSIEPGWLGPWLRIRLDPGSYTTTVTRRYYRRIIERQGSRYALRMLAMDADQLRAAFAQQSGGRVTVAG
jgi:hypothetical protein